MKVDVLGSWLPDKKYFLERDRGWPKRFLAWISKHTRLGVDRIKIREKVYLLILPII